MNDLIKRATRPARLQAVVVSLVALGTAFGLDWSGEQTAAVAAVSSAILALLFDPPERVATAVAARTTTSEDV